MWDPSWLKSRSFWIEASTLLLFMAFIITVALVKPTISTDQEIVTSTPLPTTISFFYIETDPSIATSWIVKSNTADVGSHEIIAVFNHGTGTLPTGSLSPDGNLIALLISDSDDNSNLVGKLWPLRTDGSYFQPASHDPCSWFTWRQDSQALALFDMIEPSQGITAKNRIIKLNLITRETSLIIEESAEVEIKPLGWASGGKEFVYLSFSASGRWSVFSLKEESGSRIERFSLPETDLLRNAWLSPSGGYLLMDVFRNDNALLVLSSLDGTRHVEIASVGLGLFTTPPAFTAIWSPDGQRILINQPSTSQSGTTWKTYELKGLAGIPIDLGIVEPNHYLRPLEWSPDGKWISMAELPFPHARIYIKELTQNDRLQLLLEKRTNQATWLGWSP
ncbi:MAG: hypothetical protein JW704_02375 [Anaerolineaceae bacterium]|nr:hypothetical protein [Anaerolineaceae bacterium]